MGRFQHTRLSGHRSQSKAYGNLILALRATDRIPDRPVQGLGSSWVHVHFRPQAGGLQGFYNWHHHVHRVLHDHCKWRVKPIDTQASPPFKYSSPSVNPNTSYLPHSTLHRPHFARQLPRSCYRDKLRNHRRSRQLRRLQHSCVGDVCSIPGPGRLYISDVEEAIAYKM